MAPMTSPLQPSGVWTALVTAFDDRGQLDDARQRRIVEAQVSGGVSGLVVLGSTGEFYALDPVERAHVLEVVHQATAGRMRLSAGINAGSTHEVIRNAEAAAAAGYDAVLVAPPYYSLPTQRELLAHLRAVAMSSPLPVMLYDYPARAGVPIGLDVLEGLADIDSVVAVKESSGDMSRFVEVMARFGSRYAVLAGADAVMPEMASRGAPGWVAGASNPFPRACVKAFEQSRSQIAANSALVSALTPYFLAIESGSYGQKVKRACRLAGLEVGDPREPLLPLDGQEAAAFDAVIADTLAGLTSLGMD
jgi:4-hydroxy-tetrahydrodipicolinate synthase